MCALYINLTKLPRNVTRVVDFEIADVIDQDFDCDVDQVVTFDVSRPLSYGVDENDY